MLDTTEILGCNQIDAGENGIEDKCILQVRATEIDAAHVCPTEVGLLEECPTEVRSAETGTGEVGAAEVSMAKLYDPHLSASRIAEIQNDIFQERSKGFFLGGVFISYSHVNSKFVDTLYERLGKEGANVWLDREDLKAGGIQEQVERAIRRNDVVVTVLSEESIESDWVEAELEWALKKEKAEGRNVLCPVAIDDAWKAKTSLEGNRATYTLWRKVKEKVVLDFSEWDSDGEAFEREFGKLLDGLKVNYPGGDGGSE